MFFTKPHQLTRPAQSNTEFERLAIDRPAINLSDGHARQSLSLWGQDLLARARELHDASMSKGQYELETSFCQSFFCLAGQQIKAESSSKAFFSYSASCAIKIAAEHCRANSLRILLIEPCFDNIRHLLLRVGLQVQALPESYLVDIDALSRILDRDCALWIVMPNNPTGFILDQNRFANLVTLLASKGTTLVVDFCFRMFSEQLCSWSQYSILDASGLPYLAIEDTGKAWSLGDLKIGLVVASAQSVDHVHKLHDELLLNVSPFILELLTSCIEHTRQIGLEDSIWKHVKMNRMTIDALIADSLLERSSEFYSNVPLEFLKLPDTYNGDTATFWHNLRRAGVEVLPGANYYWTNQGAFHRHFRVPLLRDQADLVAGMTAIAAEVRQRTMK